MMCFMDMTFCTAKCVNKECTRKLTDKVMDDAKKWWGKEGAPIAISDFSDTCLDYEELK